MGDCASNEPSMQCHSGQWPSCQQYDDNRLVDNLPVSVYALMPAASAHKDASMHYDASMRTDTLMHMNVPLFSNAPIQISEHNISIIMMCMLAMGYWHTDIHIALRSQVERQGKQIINKSTAKR